MNRRSFLAMVTTTTAALIAAGKVGAIATSVKTKKLCAAQEMLLRLLRECEPIALERTCTLDGPSYYAVTYRRGVKNGIGESSFGLPGGKKVRDISDIAVPTSFTVTQFVDDEVACLTEPRRKFELLKPQTEVIVTWVTT